MQYWDTLHWTWDSCLLWGSQIIWVYEHCIHRFFSLGMMSSCKTLGQFLSRFPEFDAHQCHLGRGTNAKLVFTKYFISEPTTITSYAPTPNDTFISPLGQCTLNVTYIIIANRGNNVELTPFLLDSAAWSWRWKFVFEYHFSKKVMRAFTRRRKKWYQYVVSTEPLSYLHSEWYPNLYMHRKWA